ncbi:MAG: transglutaminase domain-containing protein [Caldimicrobium sp.]|nr:transglutaminase domain-containing protein [Caldimicrobium sp.]MDW8094992.1 transglutaminase domain-containing protein [Caldimicrobium sp.]
MERTKIERLKIERFLLLLSLVIPYGLNFNTISKEFYFLSLGLTLFALILESKNFYPPRLLINTLGLLFILFFFFTVTLANFLENALRTLFLLLSLKLFEKKRLRDYFQIYLLEFLILGGTSFYYTSLWFFLLLLLQIIFIGYALYIHLYLEEGELHFITKRELKYILVSFGALLSLSLFVAGVFFVSLPRLKDPLFNLRGVEEGKAETGFTEKIRLGAFSEIQESSAVVLRFSLREGQLKDPSSLYLKTAVYHYFDGRTWERREGASLEGKPYLEKSGPTYRATFYLHRNLEDYLPIPDYTSSLRANFSYIPYKEGTYKTAEIVTYPLKYEVVFSMSASLREKAIQRELYLQVPEVSDRIKKLALKLKGKSERETLQNIVEFFQKEGFRYTIRRLPQGEGPLESFLFERKEGNCEFFAGATALLLRLNGIPARVVGGFRGALYSPTGDYYIVQERFAHSWVEVFLDGSWLRIEPSPQTSFFLTTKKWGLLERLKIYLDLLNFYYTKFILDYDVNKQRKLWQFLGGKFTQVWPKLSPSKNEQHSLKSLKAPSLMLLILLFLGLAMLVKFKREIFTYLEGLIRPEGALLRGFESQLKKRDYVRSKNMGLWEFVEMVQEEDLRDLAKQFVKIYSEYYYRDKSFDREAIRELSLCLKRLQNLK